MSADTLRPVTLTTKVNEFEAGIIVSRLELSGIKAVAVGEFTANFKAEAPGGVKVLVPFADLERARQVLAEAQPLDEAHWNETLETDAGPDTDAPEKTEIFRNFGRVSLCTAFIAAIVLAALSAGWAARHGILHHFDKKALTNAVLTGIGYGGTVGFLCGAILGALISLLLPKSFHK